MFCGFSEALAQVYRPGSILLMARSVRGGIKSKIIEAFEYGIPTVGTSSALEGFEGVYPWRVDGAALRQLVGDVSRLREGYMKLSHLESRCVKPSSRVGATGASSVLTHCQRLMSHRKRPTSDHGFAQTIIRSRPPNDDRTDVMAAKACHEQRVPSLTVN